MSCDVAFGERERRVRVRVGRALCEVVHPKPVAFFANPYKGAPREGVIKRRRGAGLSSARQLEFCLSSFKSSNSNFGVARSSKGNQLLLFEWRRRRRTRKIRAAAALLGDGAREIREKPARDHKTRRSGFGICMLAESIIRPLSMAKFQFHLGTERCASALGRALRREPPSIIKAQQLFEAELPREIEATTTTTLSATKTETRVAKLGR